MILLDRPEGWEDLFKSVGVAPTLMAVMVGATLLEHHDTLPKKVRDAMRVLSDTIAAEAKSPELWNQ